MLYTNLTPSPTRTQRTSVGDIYFFIGVIMSWKRSVKDKIKGKKNINQEKNARLKQGIPELRMKFIRDIKREERMQHQRFMSDLDIQE